MRSVGVVAVLLLAAAGASAQPTGPLYTWYSAVALRLLHQLRCGLVHVSDYPLAIHENDAVLGEA